MKIEGNSFFACDFSCDGLKYTIAGADCNVYLYDEASRELVSTMNSNGIKLPGHASRVFCTKFVPDDPNVVISGGWDRIMKMYDTRIGKPVAQIGGPQICGDSIDISGDEILAGSNRQEKPLNIFSMSMRKKIVDIEWDNPIRRDYEAGYLYGARFSKDDYRSVIFACGAGRNEAKCFDNDTEGNGKYREVSHLSDNSAAILCLDTSPNGKSVAMGTNQGKVLISPYSINKKGDDEEEQHFTMAEKLKALRDLKQESQEQN